MGCRCEVKDPAETLNRCLNDDLLETYGQHVQLLKQSIKYRQDDSTRENVAMGVHPSKLDNLKSCTSKRDAV